MIDKSKLTKSKNMPKESILKTDQVFVKAGITVLSSLAGEGKTTYMLKVKTLFENKGYNVVYFDADMVNNNDDTYCLPKEYSQFLDILESGSGDDIVIIDSLKAFSSFYNFDIMDNNSMIKLFLDLRSIISKNNLSLIFIHHSFKEKKLKTPEEHLFGSRAIEEQADSAFLFSLNKFKVIKNRLGIIRGKEIPSVYT